MSNEKPIYDDQTDKMFNEVPIDGKPYEFGDWKKYAIHDENNIKGFFGDFRWLSNFGQGPTYYEGLLYPTSENAYQAAKLDPLFRTVMQHCSAAESKRLWKRPAFRRLYTPAEWEVCKYNVMAVILVDKFFRNPDIRQKLMDTGSKYLEETNHWGDVYWGVDRKKGGENNLGQLLMKIRGLLK